MLCREAGRVYGYEPPSLQREGASLTVKDLLVGIEHHGEAVLRVAAGELVTEPLQSVQELTDVL